MGYEVGVFGRCFDGDDDGGNGGGNGGNGEVGGENDDDGRSESKLRVSAADVADMNGNSAQGHLEIVILNELINRVKYSRAMESCRGV